MERELISVIIPIYRTEPYLEKCVRSVLGQTYEALEVILVDDGSPDGCPAMCDAFAAQDGRVRVIHKENGGQGAARNRGLDIARGTYIGFVDSDDYILPDMYEKLHRALKDADADISLCDYLAVDLAGEEIYKHKYLQPEAAGPEKIFERMEFAPNTERYVTPVNRLYRREVFANIRFPEDKRYEDLFIAHLLYSQCRTIAVISDALYMYVQSENSTMRSPADVRNLQEPEGYMERYDFYRRMGRKDLAAGSLRKAYLMLWRLLSALDMWRYRKEAWPLIRRVTAAHLRALSPSAAMLLAGYARALLRWRAAGRKSAGA